MRLKDLLLICFSAFMALKVVSAQQPAERYEANWESLDKRPVPAWFRNDKFGIFIHWGVYSVPSFAPATRDGYSEWYWNALIDSTRYGHKETVEFHNKNYGPDFSYYRFAPSFRAELFDAGKWADLFRKSGARYVVLTSKHHDGYALWPSAEADRAYRQPWTSAAVGPGRDLAGELTEAVRKAGLRMGFYYSLYEWNNPYWLVDRDKYVSEHLFPQIKDLMTRYEPDLLFSDGEWDMTSEQWRSPEFLAWAFNSFPELVVNDRWGSETRGVHPSTYFTSEYGSGMMPGVTWEENRGMGESFAFNRMERSGSYKSTDELLVMLVDIVSRGGNLLLDIGPAADGTIPVNMENSLLGMGRWLDHYGDAIYGTVPAVVHHQWSEGRRPQVETGEIYQSQYNINNLVQPKDNGEAHIEAFFTRKDGRLNVIMPGYREKIVVTLPVKARRAYIPWCGKKVGLKDLGKGRGVEIDLSALRPGDVEGMFVVVLE